MSRAATLLVVHWQAWFRASVDSKTISSFPLEKADLVALDPTGVIRCKVLIGRGPFEHQLAAPHVFLWFEHGEERYPILQCPSVGPKGAALMMSTAPASVRASDEETICLVDTSLVQPVDQHFVDQYSRENQEPPVGPGEQAGPTTALVRSLDAEVKVVLDQAIGLYALYQYPVVWEPLTTRPDVLFVDTNGPTARRITVTPGDNFIPFRLNAETRVRDGALVDGALDNIAHLAGGDLHIPLVFLQQALWQKDIQVRFLENFLVIEHLARQCDLRDEDRTAREAFYENVHELVGAECPQYLERLAGLKGLILDSPLRNRLENYFAHHGVATMPGAAGRMVRLRNDLAHGAKIDSHVLAGVEFETREVARRILEKELALRGIQYSG